MGPEDDGQEVLSHLLGCITKSLLAISGGSALIYMGYLKMGGQDPVTLALYAGVGIGAVLYGIKTSLGIVSRSGERERGTDLRPEPEEGFGLEVGEEIARRPAPREKVVRPKSRLYKCPECGAQVTSGGKFCGKCGTILGED